MNNIIPYFFIIMQMPISAYGFECPRNERFSNYIQTMQMMTPNTLCEWLTTSLTSREMKCEDGRVSSDNFDLAAFRTFGAVSEFDVIIFAPSEFLSKKISGSGYESQKVKFIGFIDFSCTPRVLTYLYEPRFNLSPLAASKNPGNPNWTSYSDDQRLDLLEKFLRRSFMDLVINSGVPK